MREGKKGPTAVARGGPRPTRPISEDNASPKIEKPESDDRTVPALHVGMSSSAAATPFTLPSLIWGLLLCVLLAAIVLVRILDRALHGPLRPGDLLPDLHAAADDSQRYGAVSSQLADSPHRP